MSKAEERALEAYPHYTAESITEVMNARHFFAKGYEQAEKDLAMTIQDLELLHTFLYAVKNNKHGCFTFTRLSDEQYAEVLKRLKEAKKNSKTK